MSKTITAVQTPAQKAAATRAANKAAADEAARKEQLAAARAEAKALRAKRESEAAAHAQAVQPAPAAADTDNMAFDFSALGDFELPSWKRVVVGLILGLAGAFAVGYGIGMLMAYALAGIVTLTASAGLAFCLSVLVWIIGIYASWKIGGYVGGKIFSSVVMPEGLASRSIESVSNAASGAKQRVSSWFDSSSTVQRAKAFTGAHVPAGAA